jgi:hypothetical protein
LDDPGARSSKIFSIQIKRTESQMQIKRMVGGKRARKKERKKERKKDRKKERKQTEKTLGKKKTGKRTTEREAKRHAAEKGRDSAVKKDNNKRNHEKIYSMRMKVTEKQ